MKFDFGRRPLCTACCFRTHFEGDLELGLAVLGVVYMMGDIYWSRDHGRLTPRRGGSSRGLLGFPTVHD